MCKRTVLMVLFTLFWLTSVFASNKYPILIVHGINGESQSFKDGCMVKTLENAGFNVFTLANVGGDFSDRGQGLIQEDVKHLKQAIDEVKRRTGTEKVDILAHSRGSIVAEYYTMMHGSQYQSTMEYKYIPAHKKEPRKQTITNIPRYGDDINQIVMLGTPESGSHWADFVHEHPVVIRCINFLFLGDDGPDPEAVGFEQLQETGSAFMDSFTSMSLNQDVIYTHLAEDRYYVVTGRGDGVVSFESARGSELHQQRKITTGLSSYTPDWVGHSDLYKNVYVKSQVVQDVFDYNSIIGEISISPESPVKEGEINIKVITSFPIFPRGLLAFNRW